MIFPCARIRAAKVVLSQVRAFMSKKGCKCRVEGLGFTVYGLGFRGWGLRVEGSVLYNRVSGFWTLGCL